MGGGGVWWGGGGVLGIGVGLVGGGAVWGGGGGGECGLVLLVFVCRVGGVVSMEGGFLEVKNYREELRKFVWGRARSAGVRVRRESLNTSRLLPARLGCYRVFWKPGGIR